MFEILASSYLVLQAYAGAPQRDDIKKYCGWKGVIINKARKKCRTLNKISDKPGSKQHPI